MDRASQSTAAMNVFSTHNEVPLRAQFTTTEINFISADGTELYGKLTIPNGRGPHPVVICVQTAEAQTVDCQVSDGRGGTIEYFNLYRDCLSERGIAFFSYEGRGVRTGSKPPRFVEIDRSIFDTSTLENKVCDAMAAVHTVTKQAAIDNNCVFLLGTSEGTLLAAETATRLPEQVGGLILQSVLTNLRESLAFMYSDGAFMQHCSYWDSDHDGVITRQEFEEDPKGVRRLMPGVDFSSFDQDEDGYYTIDDCRKRFEPLIDAIRAGSDIEMINSVLRTTSTVELPKGWVEDHFSHAPTWEFLSQLTIPIGIFHGESDANTPVTGVRALQRLAAESGKTNIEFHFFPGFGHNLGGVEYFRTGHLSEPHRAAFEYLNRHAKKVR